MKNILLIILMLFSIQTKAQFYVESNTTATIENGANMYVSGDVILYVNSTLINNGKLEVIKDFFWSANWFDNSTLPYNYGDGRTVFFGNGDQFVSTINNFGTVEVNNTGLNLLNNTNSNNWYLKNGKVNTNKFYAITNSTSQNAIQNDNVSNIQYNNSWFNGNCRRYVTPQLVLSYLFPVGNTLHPNLAEMDNLTLDPIIASYIDVSFKLKQGTDVGLNVFEGGTTYTAINDGGVWDITPDVIPISGKYDLKLYFNGFTGLTDNQFAMLLRPVGSTSGSDWFVPINTTLPPTNAVGRIVAGEYARRNNISSFGQYGIGMTLAPLPLKLISFEGVKKDNDVLLNWVTSSEVNVSRYEVYRNNIYFKTVIAHNLPANNYSLYDYTPLKGLNSYNLKMINDDGSYDWSNTVLINFSTNVGVVIYPNPTFNGNVTINGAKVQQARLIAIDGKEILNVYNSNKIIVPNNLAKGSYVLQIQTASKTDSKVLLIE